MKWSLRHDHKLNTRRGPSRQTRHSSAGCANAFWCVRAFRSDGNLLFLSGMLATSGHTATVVGVVGRDLYVKAGREAAYTAALNVLALTKKQLGSLNRVSRVVRLGVYVAATPEFTEHPKIADAASELLRDVFGEATISSRLWRRKPSARFAGRTGSHLGSAALIRRCLGAPLWLRDRQHASPEAGSPASLPLLMIGNSCICRRKGELDAETEELVDGDSRAGGARGALRNAVVARELLYREAGEERAAPSQASAWSWPAERIEEQGGLIGNGRRTSDAVVDPHHAGAVTVTSGCTA
jgi:enamine deaminase RidA (YjgF/YER057c/UK114 family)